MRGQKVLVRGYRGVAKTCRIVSIRNEYAQLTDEYGFNVISSGGETDRIVTFPLSDLFAANESVEDGSSPDWNKLAQFSCNRYQN